MIAGNAERILQNPIETRRSQLLPEALRKEFTSFSCSMGAMSAVRKHVIMGLLLLMCALTGHCTESAPSADRATTDATLSDRDVHIDWRRVVDIVKKVEESRSPHSAKTEAPLTSRVRSATVEPKDLRNLRTDRGIKSGVSFPRDPRKKEKFLKYITGPLYFGSKCRKHVYRVYHHTRDCTIPAYYKRCARLLTRLASSPMCTEG